MDVSLEDSKVGDEKTQTCLENSKGCDIGYALAANSCEGVNNVDACTVTALDAITAFAVPDPNLLLAESVGFFGSGCSSGFPSKLITQLTSDQQRFIFANPFSRRRMSS